MTNPFQTETAWEVGDSILPPGDHVVTVKAVDGTGTTSGGYPQIEVDMANASGQIRDWIAVNDRTIGRVVQLTDACDVPRPVDGHVTREGEGYRLDPAYLSNLVGKEIGVRVYEEPDNLDPAKKRTRVKGYLKTGEMKGDSPAAVFAAPSSDDDIPF